MPRRSPLHLLAPLLATLTALIPPLVGAGLLIYYFVLPRSASSPADAAGDSGHLIAFSAASICLVWSAFHLPFAIATWWQKRWAFVGSAIFAGLEAFLLVVGIRYGFSFGQTWMNGAYGAMLLLSIIATLRAAGRTAPV